jgi:hypothetical protein
MKAIASHFRQHHLHMAACGVAALAVLVAIVFGVPVFALFGAAFCGVMMIGMVWMMLSMAKGHR